MLYGIFLNMKKIAIVICAILSIQLVAYAEDVKFQISLDKNKVRPGRQAALSLVFLDAKGIPPPEIPLENNISFTYVNLLEDKVTISGKMVDSTTHIYKVIPAKVGTFQIGPISVKYKNNTYTSNAIAIEVSTETEKQEKESPSVAREKADFSKRIFAVLSVPKPEIFVNEISTINVRLYSDWMYVEVNTPEQVKAGFALTGEFKLEEALTEKKDGTEYAVIEWREWFCVPNPGEYALEPVKVSASIMPKKKAENAAAPSLSNNNDAFYNNFLGSSESRSIAVITEPVNIKVIPLPAKGKPKDFKGAVGSFILDAKIDRASIKVGDTVTFTVDITGKGNYYTLNMPELEKVEGIKAYEPQTQKDANSARLKQILKIQSATVKEIPKIVFSFFDPNTREYISLVKGPIPIEVEETAKKEAGKKAKEAAAASIIYIKESPGSISAKADPYFYKSNIFILLQVLPLIAFGALVAIRKRMDLAMSDLPYARWLRAARKAAIGIAHAEALIANNNVKDFYKVIFKTMQDYFGERLAVSSGGITEKTFEDFINDKMVLKDSADSIIGIFSECYLACYSTSNLKKEDMVNMLQKVKDVIGYLNKKKEL